MSRIKLPGLIDAHVHLRDPGQTQKEDFFTGSFAGVAGGFITLLDMPNNSKPVLSLAVLQEKIKEVQKKTVSDIGLYAGTLGGNGEELALMEPFVFGLKIYCNHTTGNFIINRKNLKQIFESWNSKKPILIHAEEDVLVDVIQVVAETKKRAHICHVSNKAQLQLIIQAKENKLPITCGVTPHHLFLTEEDVYALKSFGMMRPALGTKRDQQFLWDNLLHIDIVESDHAPHTTAEKALTPPPFGVPGLETTLPLLLTAVSEKRLSLKRLIELCFEAPKKIFSIPTDMNTWIEIDDREEYIIDNKMLKTKCGWTPFSGKKVIGKLKKVVIRDTVVFDEQNQLSVSPGFGKYICP